VCVLSRRAVGVSVSAGLGRFVVGATCLRGTELAARRQGLVTESGCHAGSTLQVARKRTSLRTQNSNAMQTDAQNNITGRPKRKAATAAEQYINASYRDSDSDNNDPDAPPSRSASPTQSDDSDYKQSEGEESGAESDSSATSDASATQEAGLTRLRNAALKNGNELAKVVGVTPKEIKTFANGGMAVSVEGDLDRLSWEHNGACTMSLMAKLGVPIRDVSYNSLASVLDPLTEMNVQSRSDFARNELIPLLPHGGSIANLFMHPREAMKIVIAAHALTAGRLECQKQQERVKDVFIAMFGGESQYSDAASANVSMDSVLEGLKPRVVAWVQRANALDDAAFFRRLIHNVGELGKDKSVVRDVLGLTHRPLSVAYMDAAYKKGDPKIVKASGKCMARLQLADYDKGEWTRKLEIDVKNTKLRKKGLACLGTHTEDKYVGVCAMSQSTLFDCNDPGGAIDAIVRASRAPMMKTAQRKLGFRHAEEPGDDVDPEFHSRVPFTDGCYMHVRYSHSAKTELAKYSGENVWRLFGEPMNQPSLITVTILPEKVIDDSNRYIRESVLPDLSCAEKTLLSKRRAYRAILGSHENKQAKEVKEAKSKMNHAKKAVDLERAAAREAKRSRVL